MYKFILMIALALCSNLVSAETYKCVKGGKTSYQALPCEAVSDMQSTALKTPENRRGSSGLRCDTPKDILSLNLQNRSVLDVLQVLADFAGYRLVADKNIGGGGAFHYKNRPWCEILADIAQRENLEVRSEDGRLYVKPR